jgi:chromosomal replication initiation ATPase DnaA
MDPVFGVPFAAWPGETRVHVASVTREELDRVGWLSKAEGIARASRVSLDDLLGRVRTASVSRARHTLWLAMSRAGMSSLEIARIFGRNHATVLYGKGRIAHEQASKPRLEVSRDPGT